jgi:hypothetical protein
LQVINDLLSDENALIKRAAIKGLSKYSIFEVKEPLLHLVYDNDVGAEATELLGDFGLLPLICQENRFPEFFFPEELFKQIRKHGLTEFLPKLNGFKEKWLLKKHDHKIEYFLIDLAHTYIIMGQSNQALEIIQSYYVKSKIFYFEDPYNYSRLEKLCPIIGGNQGLKILEDDFFTVETARNSGNAPKVFDGIFMDNIYVECLEKIGGERVVQLLTEFCEKHINDMLFERGMRALEMFAPKSKEDWLITILETNKHLKGMELHRAIEAIGVIGSEKVIPLLRKIAQDNINNEYISDTCLIAIESIYHNQGKARFLEDKDLLVS